MSVFDPRVAAAILGIQIRKNLGRDLDEASVAWAMLDLYFEWQPARRIE